MSNPPPGGGLTAPVVFRVQYPAPQATSLAPSSARGRLRPHGRRRHGPRLLHHVADHVRRRARRDDVPGRDPSQGDAHRGAARRRPDTISVRVVNSAPGGGTSAALGIHREQRRARRSRASTRRRSPRARPTAASRSPARASSRRAPRKSNGVLVMTTYVSADHAHGRRSVEPSRSTRARSRSRSRTRRPAAARARRGTSSSAATRAASTSRSAPSAPSPRSPRTSRRRR